MATKYIDTDLLRKEIERQIEINKGLLDGQLKAGCLYAFHQILSFLDSLPEQTVKNCNWLVSEINKKLGHDDWLEVVFDRKTLIDFAGHFYALGLNARKEDEK